MYICKTITNRQGWFSSIRTLGVVGAGQMGTGIALVGAAAKLNVIFYDNSAKQLQTSSDFVLSLLDKDVAKAKITDDNRKATLSRMSHVSSINELSKADFVVEATTEDFAVKSNIFSQLDGLTRSDVILASNTSSISITKLAAVTKRPQQVIGMHFFNPVPVMALVELIRGRQTSDQTFKATLALSETLSKTPTTSADMPGFIANRILMPYINEAVLVLQNGIATREDIDATLKLGCNVPMGPLRLADFIGLDTCLSIMKVLHNGLGDKYSPAPLLQQYVDAGWLGKKSKRGFYEY